MYLCVPSECSTAKEDLSPVVSELFATSDNSNEKPRVLWSLYYNQVRHFISDSNLTECPENLIVTSGPSESKDLDDIVENVSANK